MLLYVLIVLLFVSPLSVEVREISAGPVLVQGLIEVVTVQSLDVTHKKRSADTIREAKAAYNFIHMGIVTSLSEEEG